MKRLYMLVEGQTEAKFVTELLSPYLATRGIITMNSTITWTGKDNRTGAKFRGGVRRTGWERVRNQMVALMKSDPSPDCLFATMFDFYGFPENIPHEQFTGNHVQDVVLLEQAIVNEVERQLPDQRRRICPLVMLHEFETFIFVDLQKLDWEFIEDGDQRKIDALKDELSRCGTAEAVDGGIETAPSKRILRQFRSYNKVSQGNGIVSRIGMENLLVACPHFKAWMDSLLAMARS